MAARCPPQRIATIDQDATLHERHKREALVHDAGGRGYQPMTAVWAELHLVGADQFRDGNVPASFAPVPGAQAAFAALPATIDTLYYRGDSACHEHEVLTWLRNPTRPTGPGGRIGFAISARLSPALATAIQALPETAWQPYAPPGESADERRAWADVPFVPSEASEQRDTEPLRDCRGAGAAPARGALCGWQRGHAVRGPLQSVGVGRGAAAPMASGEDGHD